MPPRRLPIHDAAREIVAALSRDDCLVVLGETGSGKSTQLPQILLDSGRFDLGPKAAVCVTQPRRVAAVTIAQRVARERCAHTYTRSAPARAPLTHEPTV